MSPFDAVRYAQLLEGLEVSEIQLSEVVCGTATLRMDPEYFNRSALATLALLNNPEQLGDLVKTGYRVVYQSTEAIDRVEGEQRELPYFLQAADVTTPFINAESMVCVSAADWDRYPKGRINPGELLIEVKGNAEKIAIVPLDFPKNTLVTGTLFKLSTSDEVDQYFLAAYLTCRYGQILKDRLKTNLLISYLAKDDLYGLPTPRVSLKFKQQIRQVFLNCFSEDRKSKDDLKQSETMLLQALGLGGWETPEPLSYVRSSSEAFAAGRLDAEYFHPAKSAALTFLHDASDMKVGDLFSSVRRLWQPGAGLPTDLVRNYDLNDALAPFLDGEKAPVKRGEIASTKKLIKAGDLVVARLRSYLREIAIVEPGNQYPMVASTEYIVLRPRDGCVLPVEALLVYLRSILPQLIFKWSQDGSNHPRFDEKELLRMPLPRLLIADSSPYMNAMQSMKAAKRRANQLLEAAKRAVEIAIEESEAAAMNYLETYT